VSFSAVSLFVASSGNEFMLDIAHIFSEGFTAGDIPCRIAIDEIPSTRPADTMHLVVAAHELKALSSVTSRASLTAWRYEI
jgi:hypothetical protein